jgi:hypothetical protein
MHFGAIHPKWEASNEISTKSFQLYYGHPWLAGKRLVRAMQSMQFRAKRLENDLKPTDFQKRNYYFETEAVDWRSGMDQLTLVQISHSFPHQTFTNPKDFLCQQTYISPFQASHVSSPS